MVNCGHIGGMAFGEGDCAHGDTVGLYTENYECITTNYPDVVFILKPQDSCAQCTEIDDQFWDSL